MAGTRRGKIHGVGTNDADYLVKVMETIKGLDGKQKKVTVWSCPFYNRWSDMIRRCYSEKYQMHQPTYKECTVCEEWKSFSKFKLWMEQQDWQEKELDKDLLCPGNKVYSPEACVFISSRVNTFMTERAAARGEWPIGVYWRSDREKFQAQCSNPFSGKYEYLGLYTLPELAHSAWLAKKAEHAHALAAVETDARVADSLTDRYINYHKSTLGE